MSERLESEIDTLRQRYGELEVGPEHAWVVIKRFALPAGWSHPETALLVLIPPGYPVTPPDSFYVDNELRLAGGGEPGNAPAGQAQLGRLWRMFSWHLDDAWSPDPDPRHPDNLLTFLAVAEARLSELN